MSKHILLPVVKMENDMHNNTAATIFAIYGYLLILSNVQYQVELNGMQGYMLMKIMLNDGLSCNYVIHSIQQYWSQKNYRARQADALVACSQTHITIKFQKCGSVHHGDSICHHRGMSCCNQHSHSNHVVNNGKVL